jgi:hypothetical protein
MLRDLLTQKCVQKRLLILDTLCDTRQCDFNSSNFNLMFSESTCSGVSKIRNQKTHFWVNKSLSMMCSLHSIPKARKVTKKSQKVQNWSIYTSKSWTFADASHVFYRPPDRKWLIKIISTRYLLISLITRKYLVDMILINHFRSGNLL